MQNATKKAFKRSSSLIFCALFAGGFLVACKDAKTPSSGKQTGEAHVWCMPSTQKILQDVTYAEDYGTKTLTIDAFKNENEGAQIILTAKEEIDSYTLTLSDLKAEDGTVLSKDCFSVYNQKYMFLANKDATPTGSGYYPDALLPMEKAVEYKENTIEKGKNQGIWLDLAASETQKAGLYTGEFTLKVENATYAVPVQVRIYDYVLSDEVHSKTVFMLPLEDVAYGELDATREMAVKYYDYMLDYRVSASYLPGFSSSTYMTEENITAYAQTAFEYASNERCSSFCLLWSADLKKVSWTDEKSGELKTTTTHVVSRAPFQSELRQMADLSLATEHAEKQVNVLEKACTYVTVFDEYDSFSGRDITAHYNLRALRTYCEELADEYVEKLGGYGNMSDFQKEIVDSIRYVKHLCLGTSPEGLLTNTITNTDFDFSGITQSAFCPGSLTAYGTEAGRNKVHRYVDQCDYDGELWTYSAEGPDYPYPNYHTESNMLSHRVYNWIMYDYDITGNLFWSTVMNKRYTNQTTGTTEFLQDFYQTPNRWPASNGDGYLLYAGRPYGIDGPVGSIRLHGLRDGLEEYDLLYALEEQYRARAAAKGVEYSGTGFDSIYDILSSEIHQDASVNYDTDAHLDFAAARSLLASLIEASNAGVILESCLLRSGSYFLTISAPTDVTVKYNGNALTQGVTANGLTTYEIKIPLGSEAIGVRLEALTAAGASYPIGFSFNGANGYEMGDFLKNAKGITKCEFSVGKLTGEKGEVNGLLIDYLAEDISSTVTTLNAEINFSALDITDDYASIVFDIYYDGTTESDFELEFSYKIKTSIAWNGVDSATTRLQPGWNEIRISVSELGCAVGNELTALRFKLKFESNAAIRDVRLGLGQMLLVR